MLYMVEAHASMERGNEIDGKGGPGPVFQYIVERFKPQSLHGNPTRRQIFMVVELEPTNMLIATNGVLHCSILVGPRPTKVRRAAPWRPASRAC